MNLSEMRLILESGGIRLTKSLGQNFLHDGNQIRRILGAAELGPQDRILEIGPGLGPLTEKILPLVHQVLAVELDRRLVTWLEKRLGDEPNLTLVHADALEWLRLETHDWTGWKLVSNLPYSVASPILVELAMGARPPALVVVTLQLEVARRLMASAGDPDYGLLTVLTQFSYRPVSMFKVPRGCFHPEPDVDSACITLQHRAPAGGRGEARVEDLALACLVAKTAFSQRRKMMYKLLATRFETSSLDRAFAGAHLERSIRAERVTPAQFLALAAQLQLKTRP